MLPLKDKTLEIFNNLNQSAQNNKKFKTLLSFEKDVIHLAKEAKLTWMLNLKISKLMTRKKMML